LCFLSDKKGKLLQKNTEKVDPRVRRTRQMLQQSMHELLHEKDLSDINVQDITARADLNRATFYKHFLDKYDLLNAVISERFQAMLDARLPSESTLTAAHLNILIQTGYDCVSDFHGYCRGIRVHNEHSPILQQVQQKIYQVLLNWLQNAVLRSKLPANSPENLALVISWMIAGPLLQSSFEQPQAAQQEVFRQLTTSVHKALEEFLLEN